VAGPALIGEDPMATERLWEKLYWLLSPRGQTGYASHAIAALDIALWDLKAKALGQPLWRLLGGARSRVPVYATFGFGFFERDQLAAAAKLWVSQGFQRLKMTVGGHALARRDEPRPIDEVIDEDVRRVAAVREAVGPDVKLYVDANCGLDLFHATQLARRIEPYGISFFEDRPQLTAFPSAQVDPDWFNHLVTRSWLPAIYQIWGRQVLHASAVARSADGSAVAFAGPSHAGKSTMAYGLGRRSGWSLVSDDTLAFSAASTTGAVEIQLHRLPNDARLRPASAEYFGRTAQPVESYDWLTRPPRMTAVYFLDGDPALPSPARITTLKAGESYALLLEQAHAVTLKLARHNQQLMRDYLQLAATIPVFRLTYRRSFEAFEEVVDALEDHLRSAETGPPVEIASLLV